MTRRFCWFGIITGVLTIVATLLDPGPVAKWEAIAWMAAATFLWLTILQREHR